MGKLFAIGLAAAIGIAAYVAHARGTGVREVARCVTQAGGSVRHARFQGRPARLLRPSGRDVYRIDLRGDKGTLLLVGRGVSGAQEQRLLDVEGVGVTPQGSGRILVLWKGRPSARSAAALNRCLRS
jgi:hypothetical protein